MKRSFYLGVCFFVYLLFGFCIIKFYTHRLSTLFFVWNVFLAFLPFLFAGALKSYLSRGKHNRPVILLLAFLWLIFFPNAPYMITDLIHFSGTSFMSGSDTYTTNISTWAFLVYLGSGVIVAALLGLRSQYDIHTILLRRFGKIPSAALMGAVCLLTGFGIYVGRILRFNSWDVLRPLSLLARIKEDLSSFSILFSLLFSAYIAVSYIIFYIVTAWKTPALKQEHGPRRADDPSLP